MHNKNDIPSSNVTQNKPDRRTRLLRLTCAFLAVVLVALLIFTVILEIQDGVRASASTEPTVETTEPLTPTEPLTTEPGELVPIEPIQPTEPPVTEPPVTEPPVTEPPVTEPPATEPPTAEPYVPKYFNVPLSNELQDFIFEACAWRGLDPELIIAVIKKESNYNPNGVGDAGISFGLMRIQPKWHQERMAAMGLTTEDLFNPFHNVNIGISLIADYYDAGGSIEYALMRFNSGRRKAEEMMAAGEVTSYVTKVFAIMESLERRD